MLQEWLGSSLTSMAPGDPSLEVPKEGWNVAISASGLGTSGGHQAQGGLNDPGDLFLP